MEDREYILFIDNHCTLCSQLAQWIIRIDKRQKIKFCSLTSDYAINNLPITIQKLNTGTLSTVIFQKNDQFYQQSTAIIETLTSIGFPWNISKLLYILPKFVRDWGYRLIAAHRYKLFGQSDVCLLDLHISSSRIIK